MVAAFCLLHPFSYYTPSTNTPAEVSHLFGCHTLLAATPRWLVYSFWSLHSVAARLFCCYVLLCLLPQERRMLTQRRRWRWWRRSSIPASRVMRSPSPTTTWRGVLTCASRRTNSPFGFLLSTHSLGSGICFDTFASIHSAPQGHRFFFASPNQQRWNDCNEFSGENMPTHLDVSTICDITLKTVYWVECPEWISWVLSQALPTIFTRSAMDGLNAKIDEKKCLADERILTRLCSLFANEDHSREPCNWIGTNLAVMLWFLHNPIRTILSYTIQYYTKPKRTIWRTIQPFSFGCLTYGVEFADVGWSWGTAEPSVCHSWWVVGRRASGLGPLGRPCQSRGFFSVAVLLRQRHFKIKWNGGGRGLNTWWVFGGWAPKSRRDKESLIPNRASWCVWGSLLSTGDPIFMQPLLLCPQLPSHKVHQRTKILTCPASLCDVWRRQNNAY